MLTKEKVLASIKNLPDEFSADELIDRTIFLQKVDTEFQQSEERKLFTDWKKYYEPTEKFIEDGIVDKKKFMKSKPRILFILKELNDPHPPASYDIRKFYRNLCIDSNEYKNIKNKFFIHRIGEWAFGIWNNFPTYSEISEKEKLEAF